jgi:acyl carrier protein
MSTSVSLEEIIDLLEEATLSLPSSIAADTDLRSLSNLDSIGFVSFVGLVSSLIGVELIASDFQGCNTPRDLHAVVVRKAAQ